MDHERSIRRYLRWYSKLLRLYSRPYLDRFGEGMEQTFNDLLRERAGEGRGLFGSALWMFAETSAGILRQGSMTLVTRNRSIIRLALATAFLLLVPMLAMLFTDEVAWGPEDFVFAGVMIFGTGLTYQLVTRRKGTVAYKVAVGVALASAFILVWANLAVGLIGSEGELANLMYFGVLAVGIGGAILVRFQPSGMVRVLFTMALAQVLVALIALIAGMHRYPGSSVTEILGVNGFFVALFILSAILFQRASATDPT